MKGAEWSGKGVRSGDMGSESGDGCIELVMVTVDLGMEGMVM